MEVDHDEILAEGDDGTPASEDFGDLIVSDCFIPQIVYSTTNGYRTDVAEWKGRNARGCLPIFDLENFPGYPHAGTASDQQHGMGASVRRRRYGRHLPMCLKRPRVSSVPSPCSTPSRKNTLWWTSAAEAVQYLAGTGLRR